MKIGGWESQSLSDWDGKIVAVIFTQGCNLRCRYCHNPSLVLPELFHRTPAISETDILTFLKKRKGWLDGVVITGGEPTLQPDLTCFIKKINALDLPVKLDTNGTQPVLLRKLIADKRIHAVAMDIKTELSLCAYRKIDPAIRLSRLNRIRESVRIIRQSGIAHRFRMTVIPGIQTEEEIFAAKEFFKEENLFFQTFRPGDLVKNYLSDKESTSQPI